MSIEEISDSIWSNSVEISFGEITSWDNDTFKKGWFTQNNILTVWDSGSPGWYWFICNISYEKLHKTVRPSTLPSSECDYGLVSHENIDTFGGNYLCGPINNEVVVYNGHEGNVMSRIRTHFDLKNNQTGALGIRHYPLSQRIWKVKIFTQQYIGNLPVDLRGKVRTLINNKTGRCSIESAWRVRNGWPILCKE